MTGTDSFLELRPLLFGVAYRMLGSVSDAEDIVQEAYLRWESVDQASIDSPRGFLTTVVIRLALDQLRSARSRRESYVGPWLPEPLLVDDADPSRTAELADTLSMAFLVVLETLSPPERAAFLLREVFAFDYAEIAQMLARQEPSCRQLVARARRRVAERRQRFDADRETCRQLTQRFIQACATGDLDGILGLLAEDVTVWTDGGGRVKAALRPVIGATKAARFLLAIAATITAEAVIDPVWLNGQPGMLIRTEDGLNSAAVLDIIGGRISGIRVVSNPEKLVALGAGSAGPTPGGGGPAPA